MTNPPLDPDAPVQGTLFSDTSAFVRPTSQAPAPPTPTPPAAGRLSAIVDSISEAIVSIEDESPQEALSYLEDALRIAKNHA